MPSFLKYFTKNQNLPLIEFFLVIWALLSFISADILLAKVFLILAVCLVVRNNLCSNSPSSKFFWFSFNIVSALFFAADFVSVTMNSWWFTISCNIVISPCENLNLVSLNFSKIMKTNMDSSATTASSAFFSCSPNSICYVAFGSAFNSFCII